MLRVLLRALLLAGILPLATSPSYAEKAQAKTRVIVLGVNHRAQLVSERDSPATLAAFIHRLRPDAVCVERAPDRFARGDQYEFTYEIQSVIVPLARRDQFTLCPFDWSPPVADQELGFGVDVETPPEVRAPADFQGFLFFPDKAALLRDIFEADDSATLKPYIDFATTPAPNPSQDFARRLFLYRTFLQAKRIRAAAVEHRGGTVLVVVGEFHKRDLEAHLAAIDSVAIASPSSVGRPSVNEVAAATTLDQEAAILSFNLLGRQAETHNVNWDWIGRVLANFERRNTSEARLFRLRFEQLTGRYNAKRLMQRYLALARTTPDAVQFTWTGAQDTTRVDSYFDPYGNLNVSRRARLEAARVILRTDARAARELISQVTGKLTQRQARQLAAYWRREEQQIGATSK